MPILFLSRRRRWAWVAKGAHSLLYSVYAIAILNGQQILTVVRIHACILFKRWKKICNVMLDGTSDKNDNSVRIYLPHSVFFYVFCTLCYEGCFLRVLSLQRLGTSYLLLLVQYCEDQKKRPLGGLLYLTFELEIEPNKCCVQNVWVTAMQINAKCTIIAMFCFVIQN